MSNLSMVEAKLPPGFRFHPRDEELIGDYLMKKVTCCECPLLIEVDLNKCEPWDIPVNFQKKNNIDSIRPNAISSASFERTKTACVGGKEWYFYSQRDRKYATGLRTNRATVSGYWKATGKDRPVLRRGTLVGMRKTLVFYQGRAPKGRKSEWVMHEFRIEGPLGPPKTFSVKEDWVLCRVFYKNREVVPAKHGTMGSCSSYDDTSSSSLPPLMDSYITFDQTRTTNLPSNDQYEQVPCFSIFTAPNHHQIMNNHHHHHPPSSLSHITHMDPNISTKITTPTTFGALPPDHIGSYLDPYSCDKKVITAVLNHLTQIDSNPNMKGSPSLGEGSSESFLSDVGMPNMWNNY